MKVSGFTFIKNAILYDYPIVEAIRSILPLCDEVVVAVGRSEDGTMDLIRSIDDKIRIIETEWDESLREGGRVLALETDKAFKAIDKDSEWAFYIQGDEVMHEKYLPVVKDAMLRWKDDPRIDGLLFGYKHFYASYDFVGASSNWYRNEVRVIRNDPSIYSYRDAQGFRKGADQKLNVVRSGAEIYHYGWVKQPQAMQRKQENFHKMWHDDAWVEANVEKADTFNYEKHVRRLSRFRESHPKYMQERIDRKNWEFKHDPSMDRSTMKDRVKDLMRTKLGLDVSYRNYRLLK